VGMSEQHHSTPHPPRRLPAWPFGRQPADAAAPPGGPAARAPAKVVVTGVFDDDVRAEQAAAALRVWARANRTLRVEDGCERHGSPVTAGYHAD
jgi:hypothetical protein